jgi:hypothetical protein
MRAAKLERKPKVKRFKQLPTLTFPEGAMGGGGEKNEDEMNKEKQEQEMELVRIRKKRSE